MGRSIFLLVAGLLAGLALGQSGGWFSRAQAFESFTLEQHDVLLAEAPGCYASCAATGTRRLCTVREMDCKAVCRVLPQCRPDGMPMQVCAVMRATR